MSKMKLSLISLASVMVLAACGNGGETEDAVETDPQTEETATETPQETETQEESSEDSSEGHEMVHDESGELPEGISEASDPAFSEGSTVILTTDHMPGMEGAEAEVVGAFDTTAYEVTYEDSETGEMVENHRWVVQEEITEAKDQEEALEVGDEVTLEAYHMPGMEGQTATIDDVQDTVVYMVDYEATDGSGMVRNHKWVTEEEVEPAE